MSVTSTKSGTKEGGNIASGPSAILFRQESAYLMSNWEEAELQCQLDGVTVSPEFSNLWNLKNDSPYFLHAISLLRETTWALAAPILNQLESLTIP